MSHTVTITRLPDEDSDDYEYTFGGEHGGDCEVYVECARKACQAMNPDYAPHDERFRHGKRHIHLDVGWCAETDICALRYVFEGCTEGETFEGIEVGTYPIRIEFEDGSFWVEVQNPKPTDLSPREGAERGRGSQIGTGQ